MSPAYLSTKDRNRKSKQKESNQRRYLEPAGMRNTKEKHEQIQDFLLLLSFLSYSKNYMHYRKRKIITLPDVIQIYVEEVLPQL